MIRIEIADVEVAYDAHPVLRGTSLQIEDGEFVGLIGPNGCGKTTLLRVISGLLPARKGHATIDGRDVQTYGRPELARTQAAVGQELHLDFDFTVEEIVQMGRMPHLKRFQRIRDKDRRAVQRALERTGLEEAADRLVTELSGGERQRVAIARALAQEPSILLLDEPTAHLDIHYQVALLDLIRGLNRSERMTVFAVLHDLNLAAQYCDRLILMHHGRVHRAGKPDEVLVPQTLHEVYGVRVLVHPHPMTDVPVVLLLSDIEVAGPSRRHEEE